MAPEKLTRTSYRDDNGNPRDGVTALAESRRDMEEHLQPLLRVHASTLHGPGVATGLPVTATPGGTTITVGPGVAVDPLGRHLSLAPGGHALLGTAPDPVPVTPTGIVLDLATLTPVPAAGRHHLTLAHAETFDDDAHASSGGTIYELDHTPRLALHPTATPPAEAVVVLAQVTLAANATITNLDPGTRQTCPTPTGEITVAQPRVTPDPANPARRTVDDRVAGRLTALPDGGLTLRSTHLHTDSPHTVHGALTADGTTDLRGNTTLGGTLTTAGTLTVGTDLTVRGKTELHGSLGTTGPATVPDLNVRGALTADGTTDLRGNTTLGGTLTTAGTLTVGTDLTVRGKTELHGSLGTTGPATVPDLNVRGTLSADGTLRLGGDLQMQPSKTISSTGRLHVSGAELLYLLNTSGVVVGKEWGGTGTLLTQGNLSTWADLSVGGSLHLSNDLHLQASKTITASGRLHVSGDELLYLLNKSGVVVGKEWGGTGTLHAQGNLSTNGNLTVQGAISWSGDQTAARLIRLGAMQLCWGFLDVNVTTSGYHPRNVTFPRRFAEDPVVTVSLSDTGYGVGSDEAGVGAWALHPGGFTAAYKANVGVSNIRIFWMAIGLGT